MKYSAIVFDLGNVLIPFDYSIMVEKLNTIDTGLGDRFYAKYKENYHIHRQFEKWELTNDEFLKIMLEWCEEKVTEEEFCSLYSNIFRINEFTTGLLPLLKEKYKLVLLSNTNDIHEKYGWGQYSFLKYFNKIFTSHSVRACKPEPEIYQAVMNYTQLPQEEHLFIDDVKEYINGAKNMGWDGIQFLGNENLKAELETRGIL